jgi:mannose-1-phosphate guanylyltransferase
MKALILAGGFGTRLRPLTFTRPKHLLPIANRPHIEHVFDLLARHSVDEVVLLTSYLAAAFDDTVARARTRGVRVEVTHEEAPLGTAGALKNAERFVGSETFLAFNGDVLADVDLAGLVAWHRARAAETTILLTPVEDPSAYGVVPTAEDGRVLGFIEKPPPGQASTNLINAGVYVFEPSVLEEVPRGEVWSAERQLFPGLVATDRPVFALGTDSYWMDIGTPGKYLQANLDALSGAYRTDAVGSPGEETVVSADSVRIDPGARVSSACLGAGATVGSGATIERSVLLPSAVVSPGAVVVDSVLGESARVEPEVSLAGATIADGEVVRG